MTGLLLPFIVCTVSLVVLSAVVSQHQISQSEIAVFKNTGEVHLTESKPVREILNQRIIHEIGFDHFDALAPFQQDELILSLPPAEKHLAALSVPNGIKEWIEILNEIGGSVIQPILGIAVLLICLSSTILLMIINGHLLCCLLYTSPSPRDS